MFQAHLAGVTLKNTIRLKFNQNPAKEQEWEGGVAGGRGGRWERGEEEMIKIITNCGLTSKSKI